MKSNCPAIDEKNEQELNEMSDEWTKAAVGGAHERWRGPAGSYWVPGPTGSRALAAHPYLSRPRGGAPESAPQSSSAVGQCVGTRRNR